MSTKFEVQRLTLAILCAAGLSAPLEAQIARDSADSANAADSEDSTSKSIETVNVLGTADKDVGTVDEQRKDATVNTVMTHDQLVSIPAANIADVVSHLPGVSAYSDMQLGQAATGESEYVTIRGMDASYNSYTLNGVPMPETDASTRAVSLNMLAPFGLQSVKVSKAPTPDMPGDSIGGTIDMRTPTAFDFDSAMHSKTTVQGKLDQLAYSFNQPAAGGTIQEELMHRFDAAGGTLGVYAAGYYGKNSTVATADSPNSEYTPVNPADSSATDYRGVGALTNSAYHYDFYTNQIERYGANLSFDWRGETTSLYLRALYGMYKVKGEDNQVGITNVAAYDAVLRGAYFETRDMNEYVDDVQLGGATRFDRLSLDYGASFGTGSRERPNYVEASLYGPLGAGEATFDTSNPARPSVVNSSSSVTNYLYNLGSDSFWKTQGHDAASADRRLSGHADGLYQLDDQGTSAIKFGFSADTSKRSAYDHPFFHDDNNFIYGGPYFGGPDYSFLSPGGPSLAVLPGTVVNGAFGGEFDGPIKLLSRDWVLAQAVPYKYVNDPNGAGNYTENDYSANTTWSRENIYSGYVMWTWQPGPLTVIPGLRYEYTDYSATSWVSNGDDATGHFATTGRGYGEVLPGLDLAYRPDPLTVYRASVRRSFSRPAFGLLSGETSYAVNDITGQVSISAPNPNLKPTTATNLDMSAELYDSSGGLLTASAYYKWLNRFIYTAESGTTNDSTLGGNVPSDAVVSNGATLSMPENGGSAKLYGVELAARKQLTMLSGIWSHFGLGANVTLQRSSADSLRADHFGRDTWLPRAPEEMYNLDVFYASPTLHADLTYNYTGLQLIGLNSDDLDLFLQPVKMLDFNLMYNLPLGLSAGFSVKNLLNSATFYETEGRSTQYLAYDAGGNGSYVQTGRLWMVTLGYAF